MNPEQARANTPPLEAQVVAERVRGLYGRAALPLVTVVVNSSALAYVVYTPGARVRIGGWLAALFAVSMLRAALIVAFRRASPAPVEAERWGWYFAAGSAANGILWGASAILLYPPDGVVLQAVILLVLGGMSAGAAASAATFFPAFLAFTVPALAPITVRLLAEGDKVHVALGGMAALFGVAMSQIALSGGRRLIDAVHLRFSNAALVADLDRARARLAATNDELERRVGTRTAELVGAVRQHERDEEALRLQKEVFQKVFDHSPVMLILYDAEGRVALVNREFEQRLGWSLAELQAKEHASELYTDPAEHAAMRDHVTTGASTWKDFHCCAKDGRPLDVSWASVRLSDGMVVILGQDITLQRKAREALALSERMASVGTLAAGVAHEINNPLSFVLSNVEFAQNAVRGALEDTSAPSSGSRARLKKTLEALADAYAGAWRVRNIVRDLNTFSRGTDELAGPVDLIEVLETSLRMADNQIKHRARIVRRFEAIPHVSGQGSRLGQVFLNLLLNAAQAIPEGNASGNEIVVATRTDASGRAVVEVRDTGSGIPEEVLPRILDPFFTTKRVGQGMGLGLSICHGIVTSLGGEIEVESEVGVGSVFRVLLPAETRSARPVAKGIPSTERIGHRRVLVVDDEATFGSTVARMLDEDHEVVAETSARSALARIRDGQTFDVVLCDLMMPDITGMEFFGRLSEEAPHLAPRIIFITGGAFTGAAREFLESVPNLRLSKPFTKRELDAALLAVLGGEGSRRPAAPPLSSKDALGTPKDEG